MSFFRYPGGKRKVKDVIINKMSSLIDDNITEYREPFFGGGSIGIDFLQICSTQILNKIDTIWINDFDIGMSCLWSSVIQYPQLLKEKINNFLPSIEKFYEFKEFLKSDIKKYRNEHISQIEMVDIGFKKIAIHQISYSGLGTMSGSPLGGHNQKSDYKVDCRWSPDYLCKKIDKINKLFCSYKFSTNDNCCSSFDFENLLCLGNSKAIIYLDPPYFDGPDNKFNLYQHAFCNDDHNRLNKVLKNCDHKWLLSYNDCVEIRNMYSWATIKEIDIGYSISGIRQKRELLIWK